MFFKPQYGIVLLASFVILLCGASSFNIQVTAPNSSLLSSSTAKNLTLFAPGKLNSTNWSGYAVNAAIGSVTQVKGSWIEPLVKCPAIGFEAVAFWVGIDGLTPPISSTVEQTGTIAECYNGAISYFAWYEFYPSGSVLISAISVTPGDKISASVSFSTTTSEFTISIKDVTTGQSFSYSAMSLSAVRSSAEWITEAPSSGGNILPLPKFGTVYFGKDHTLVTGTDTATISGSTKVISKFGSMVESITMVNHSTRTSIKTQPSKLSKDGTSFSVKWISAGP
jgi:hypothetical protein